MGPATQQIDGAVARDTHEPPGNATSAGIVRLSPVPRSQERVLEHFRGRLAIADDREREREDEPPIPRVQRFEGRLVPEPHPVEQFGIGWLLGPPASRLAAPHTHAYVVTMAGGSPSRHDPGG